MLTNVKPHVRFCATELAQDSYSIYPPDSMKQKCIVCHAAAFRRIHATLVACSRRP